MSWASSLAIKSLSKSSLRRSQCSEVAKSRAESPSVCVHRGSTTSQLCGLYPHSSTCNQAMVGKGAPVCIPSHVRATVSFSRCCYFVYGLVREMVVFFCFFTILFLEGERFSRLRTSFRRSLRKGPAHAAWLLSAQPGCRVLLWWQTWGSCSDMPCSWSHLSQPWLLEEDSSGLLPTAPYWLLSEFVTTISHDFTVQ